MKVFLETLAPEVYEVPSDHLAWKASKASREEMGNGGILDPQDPKVNLDFRVFPEFLEAKESEDTRVRSVTRAIEDLMV
jgi:hypothetical protein